MQKHIQNPVKHLRWSFFLEYGQKLKAIYYFHKNSVKRILNTTLECILSWKRITGKLIKLRLKLSMFYVYYHV